MRGRNSVCALEFVGKIVAVVESAGKCYFGDRSAGLVFEHILGFLQAERQQILGEAEAYLALE